MAEKLKVFVNKTLTTADLLNGDTFVLATNDATTQAVIKDIQIDTSNSTVVDNSALYNGTYKLSDTALSMSGSEIIDTSTTFTYKLVPSLYDAFTAQPTVQYASSTTLVYKDIQTSLGIDYPLFPNTTVGLPTSNTSKTVPTMSLPCWYYETDTSAFYLQYDGNSTTTFYKAPITAGVVGSWALIDGSSYAYKCVDIVNKAVYWVDSTTLHKYDMTTLATSSLGAFSAGVISSYSHSAFCNGVFFYQCNNGYATLYWHDTNTGVKGSVPFIVPGSNGSLIVTYNPVEDTYYAINQVTSTYTVYAINSSLTTSTAKTMTLPISPNTNYAYKHGDAYGNIYLTDSNNDINTLHINASGITLVEVYANNISNTAYGPIVELNSVSAVVADFDIRLTAKVSGVEITGV